VTGVLRATAYALCAEVETLLTAMGGFDLAASPLQRAICRLADGRALGDLGERADVCAALGCGPGAMPTKRPREIAILSGIRVGKSLLAAALALHWAVTCDLTGLAPGEVPRVSIVSTTKDNADVVFGHVVGHIGASAWLSSLIIGKPTNDAVLIRHPSGRAVEIKVVAGSRAGSTLVSRWSAGCIFDEFPRMIGGDEGVVNWDDSRAAVLLRLRPGAQLVHIGSPWAPFGPAYEMVATHHGKPSERLVLIIAPAYDMNPAYWTPERCAEAKAADADVYLTDVEAKFASPEESLFPGVEIDRVTRAEPPELPPVRGAEYAAAMDPATRGNAWTLVIATREGRRRRVVLARQWIGSRIDPLSSGMVLAEIGALCKRYGIDVVQTDQYYVDALAELARARTYTDGDGVEQVKHPIVLQQSMLTEAEKVQRWLALRLRVSTGEVEFPPDGVFRADMQRVKKRTTQSGVQVVLPKTSDGRHCDFAPAVLLALDRYLDDIAEDPPAPGTEAALLEEQRRAREAAVKRWGRKRQ